MPYFNRINVYESIELRQAHLKNVLFVTIGIFLDKGFKFQSSVCYGCHDVLMMSIDINSIVILNMILIIVVLLLELAKVKL